MEKKILTQPLENGTIDTDKIKAEEKYEIPTSENGTINTDKIILDVLGHCQKIVIDSKKSRNADPSSETTPPRKISAAFIAEEIDKRINGTKTDNKTGHVISIPTISRRLKEWGYSRESNYLICIPKKVVSEHEAYVTNTLNSANMCYKAVSTSPLVVFYSVNLGFERYTEELVWQLFSKHLTGCIAGRCCLMLIFTSEEDKKIVRREIKKLKTIGKQATEKN